MNLNEALKYVAQNEQEENVRNIGYICRRCGTYPCLLLTLSDYTIKDKTCPFTCAAHWEKIDNDR